MQERIWNLHNSDEGKYTTNLHSNSEEASQKDNRGAIIFLWYYYSLYLNEL